jgi:hypothetical protein
MIRKSAKVLHITPGVSQNLFLSTVKFADANYITIFDNDEVNIFNANDTSITVTKGAILRGWRDTATNLWRIPLVRMVRNLNTDTALWCGAGQGGAPGNICNPSVRLNYRPLFF